MRERLRVMAIIPSEVMKERNSVDKQDPYTPSISKVALSI